MNLTIKQILQQPEGKRLEFKRDLSSPKPIMKTLTLSFPGPIPPVNNETLKKERVIARDYRNSRLGDFLKELHLTEGRSAGIPKIRRFMQANGSPSPVFETDADNAYFLTILYPHQDFIQEQIIDSGDKSSRGIQGTTPQVTPQVKNYLKY